MTNKELIVLLLQQPEDAKTQLCITHHNETTGVTEILFANIVDVEANKFNTVTIIHGVNP